MAGWMEAIETGTTKALEGVINWFLGVVSGALVEFYNYLVTGSFQAALDVKNPYVSAAAKAAWNYNLEIALGLLPVIIVLGLLSKPAAKPEKTTLFRMSYRLFLVIIALAVIQPMLGFSVDMANELTAATVSGNNEPMMNSTGLNSSAVEQEFGGTQQGSKSGKAASTIMVMVFMAIAGSIVSTVLIALAVMLVLRNFMVWLFFVGSPIFLVMWYLDWGPFKGMSSFATRFGGATAYLLLSGPVVGIVLQVSRIMTVAYL